MTLGARLISITDLATKVRGVSIFSFLARLINKRLYSYNYHIYKFKLELAVSAETMVLCTFKKAYRQPDYVTPFQLPMILYDTPQLDPNNYCYDTPPSFSPSQGTSPPSNCLHQLSHYWQTSVYCELPPNSTVTKLLPNVEDHRLS